MVKDDPVRFGAEFGPKRTGTSTGVGSVDTSSGSGFLSGTYKGTVGIGQFRASLTLIIAIILAIIMVL